MTNDDDLRTALTKLLDEWPEHFGGNRLRALLAAHPAPETDDEPMDVFQLKAQRERTSAPVSDTRVTVVADDVKMLRETLCEAQTAILNRMAPGHALPHADRLQALVAQLDVHRPLGPDGKHGDRHTATCGCEDVPVSGTRREDAARALLAAHIAEFEASVARLEASIQDPNNTVGGREYDTAKLHGQRGAVYALRRLADVLAVLPAPPVVDEAGIAEVLTEYLDEDMTEAGIRRLSSAIAARLRGATR